MFTTRQLRHQVKNQSSSHTPNPGFRTPFSRQKKLSDQKGLLPERARLLLGHRPFIQPKLTISPPNGKYEQEADRVAEQVMHMPESTVQRQPKMEGEEEVLQTKLLASRTRSLIQRQMEPEEEEELIQPKPTYNTKYTSENLHSQISALGNGQPLSTSVRDLFEPRFGYDFSRVRVHTGAAAAQMAQTLNARALTIGRNIVFRTGQYDPGNTEWRKLLAHELTHVVQQTQMSSIQKKERLLQRMVKPGFVSCRNYPPSHPVMQAIGTTDPVKEIEDANARAIELLDTVIDELEGTRNDILEGATIGWPTISDATALALSNRFRIDPDSRRVWTGKGTGTVDVLIKRFRAVRKILNGGWIYYKCLGDLTDCCDPGTWACASEGVYQIELCRPWWDSSSLDEQAGTLLHESCHIYFGFIDDVGHLGNANCYEQFVYDINDFTIEDGCP